MCYRSTLEERFQLNDAWIARLGAPDKIVDSKYNSWSVCSLYAVERVERFLADHQAEYDAYLEARKKRKAAAARALATRRANALLRRCVDCRARIPREAPDQTRCAGCSPRWEAKQAARAAARAAWPQAEAEAPEVVHSLLAVLHDLWMLNHGVRYLTGRERACWYTLKDAVLLALWQRVQGEPLVLTDPIDQWLLPWNEAGDLVMALPTGDATAHMRVSLAHTTGPGRDGGQRSYLALVFAYGPIAYPFHAPWENARSWLPMAIWQQLQPRRWAETEDGDFAGRTMLSPHQHIREDWPARINRLIAFTGRPRSKVFFDPLADYYDAIRARRRRYAGWDDEDDGEWDDLEDWEEW